VTAGSVRAMATATWGLGVTDELAVTGWRGTLAGTHPAWPWVAAGITTFDWLNHLPPKGCWFVHRRLPAWQLPAQMAIADDRQRCGRYLA